MKEVKELMTKIPIQISESNRLWMNENHLSYAKILNKSIEKLRTECSGNSNMEKLDEYKLSVK